MFIGYNFGAMMNGLSAALRNNEQQLLHLSCRSFVH